MNVSSNQTIGGVKNFSGTLSVTKPIPRLQIKSTTYSSETSSAMTIGEISLLNNNGSFSTWIVHQLRADLTKRLCFRVYPHDNSAYKGFAFDDSCNLYPENSNSALGIPTQKWKTLNGINPGALSLPDLDNGIDISGYISTGSTTNDSYTAPADGYLAIIMSSSSPCGLYAFDYSKGIFMHSNSITDSTYNNVCGVFIPVLKNQTMNIVSKVTENIVSAKFFPCLGNV